MTPTIPHHLNVLLVDDDADDHEFFLHAITKAKTPTHVKIKTVKDGSEITAALLNGYGRLPDIIFLDINMPSKNGHEILQEIRRQKKLNDVAIAIFTTSSSDYDIYKAHENGANLYIKKPDEVSELVAIMEKVLALDWKNHKPHSTIDEFVWAKQSKVKR
ncbi:MAG TPA: response regulator [Chitinophagales bacterium]|nr:response regulator [Chitinophagales bacterium]